MAVVLNIEIIVKCFAVTTVDVIAGNPFQSCIAVLLSPNYDDCDSVARSQRACAKIAKQLFF
jgi:hypothetical protein